MTSYVAVWMLPVLLVFIFAGLPVAFSLMAVAFIFGLFRFGDVAVFQLVSKVDDIASNYVLAAVPLFIFMGTVLERSGSASGASKTSGLSVSVEGPRPHQLAHSF